MNRSLILTPAAEQEFEEAATWYEQVAELGEEFVEQVQQALNRIEQSPELPAILYRNIRRVRVAQFPYCVYYRVLADHIEVTAVFHNKRNPKIWQSRA